MSAEKSTNNPVSLYVSFSPDFICPFVQKQYKNINKMENKTTILLYRNTINRLYKKKKKIGDTYDKVLNDILDQYEKENKGK